MTTTVKYHKDEWYPVYVPWDGATLTVDVPDELAERWVRLAAEFEAVNVEVGRIIAPDLYD